MQGFLAGHRALSPVPSAASQRFGPGLWNNVTSHLGGAYVVLRLLELLVLPKYTSQRTQGYQNGRAHWYWNICYNNLRSTRTARDQGKPVLCERKKFYQTVNISHGEGGFEINLDRKKLKTPQGNLFVVPNEALAIAVATEWDSQKDTLKLFSMHLTALCNTALDNPTQRNKEQLIRAAVKFLETDTICYRVDEPQTLVELQKNEWDPMLDWAQKRFNVSIGSSTSILGPKIPAETKDTFVKHLASYNTWGLIGMEFVITHLKSLILAMGLLDRHLTVEKAVLLSRLEEEYQIQHWGNVEWAHDYEFKDLCARTAAGTLFVHFCSESSTVKHKLLQD
ncbi:ATP synthase mitochondrial F1 complex assembly factor 2 [Ambystoma mexicanum]|uniref:ATP synthase mitochondrial F1 complex assembly factor 2 n=1 Tax=Ambystoma mexicanum TaxID=8296 RepID=UPI0037E800E0